MQIRRSLVWLCALAVVLAGCGGGAPAPSGPAATSAASVDPAAELAAAARKLNETTMKINQTSPGTTSTGSLDPRRKRSDLDMRISAGGRTVTVQVRTVGEDAYIQADGLPGVRSGTWLEIAGSRLAGSTFYLFPENDPAGVDRLANALSDIEKDGPGRFSGTIDLTKANPNKAVVDLGDKVKALPFTATVDDQGRLTRTEIDMTSVEASAGKTTTTYSDFGAAVTVEPPPAGETVPAPDEVVKLLTGG